MENKYIALTFDDGPNTVTTPQVLEMLKKHNVTGSFFLVGDNINEESARIARECFEYGCEICNHSRTHSAMPQQTSEEIKAEIEYTNDKIKQITGGAQSADVKVPRGTRRKTCAYCHINHCRPCPARASFRSR